MSKQYASHGPKSSASPSVKRAIEGFSPLQRQVYDAMLAGRTGNIYAARADALIMIETATRQGTLHEELAYWTEEPDYSEEVEARASFMDLLLHA